MLASLQDNIDPGESVGWLCICQLDVEMFYARAFKMWSSAAEAASVLGELSSTASPWPQRETHIS